MVFYLQRQNIKERRYANMWMIPALAIFGYAAMIAVLAKVGIGRVNAQLVTPSELWR